MKLPDRVQDFIDRVGMAGVVGIGLLLVALATLWLLDQRLETRRNELQAELSAAQRATTPGSRALQLRQLSTSEQLRQFYARFPPADAAAKGLGVINRAAAASGISLQSGEYRMEQRPEDMLRRYRVLLPVQGSYAQLRAFVDRVLLDLPSASLDEIELRRDASAGAEIQARLRFTLHLQGRP